MNGLGQDFTYGLLSLRRQRGFTALALVVLGSAIGLNTSLFTLIGAAAASQLLRSHLYGLSPLDPLVYVGVTLVLAAAGATATCVPARRALRVDPIVALRYE